MIVQIHVYYLAATLVILAVAYFRKPVTRDSAVALLVWYTLANATYQYGEVEWAATFIIIGIQFVVLGFVAYRHGERFLPILLLCFNGARLIFNAWYGTDPEADPYTYKLGKNLIYVADLLAVGLACLPWERMWTKTRKKSDGS